MTRKRDGAVGRRRILRAALLAGVAALLARDGALAAPQPSGELLQVAGTVRVSHTGAPAVPVLSLFQLSPGDVVSVAPRASARVVLYDSGRCFRLESGAVARVRPGGLDRRSGPPPRPDGSVPPGLSRGAAGGRREMGGFTAREAKGAAGPRDLRPAGAARVPAPVFRWEGRFEGEGTPDTDGRLELELRDARDRVVASASLPLAAREWKPERVALERGETYGWSVRARGGAIGDRTATARFRVLFESEAAAVEAAEAAAKEAAAADPHDPAPLCLLARAYARCGLLADALAAYRSALALQPGDDGIGAAIRDLESAMRK